MVSPFGTISLSVSMMMPDILSLSTAESSLLCSTLMVTRTLTRSPLSGRPYSLTCLTRRVLSAMTRHPLSMRRRKVKRSSESSGITKKQCLTCHLALLSYCLFACSYSRRWILTCLVVALLLVVLLVLDQFQIVINPFLCQYT